MSDNGGGIDPVLESSPIFTEKSSVTINNPEIKIIAKRMNW